MTSSKRRKAFQIWYPESFMRILGDDNILSSVGSMHKHMRNMVLRVFGPENLRLVLFSDVQSAVKGAWHHGLRNQALNSNQPPLVYIHPSIFCLCASVICHVSTFISPGCVLMLADDIQCDCKMVDRLRGIGVICGAVEML